MQSRIAQALIIIVVTIACYWPAMRGGLIMDDDLFLTDNRLVTGEGGLYRIWFTTQPMDYWPVTNSSFWLEWRLWGERPTGYHVTNLALHAACALLLWAVLERLGIPGGWLAGLLFAVHPVNVQAVAWIAQRKTLLAMLFALLSVFSYFGRRPWYWTSLACFVLAMLGKGSVAMLPLVLLLIVWWRDHGAVRGMEWLRVAPFFAVAAVLTVVNIWFQTHGSAEPIRDATFLQRLLGACTVIWFYLYKAVLPLNLLFIYPQWHVDPADWRWWVPLAATLTVTGLLIWQCHTWLGRALLFAWLYFVVALVPVMGFTDTGFMRFALVSDQYQYVAIIGIVALVATAVARLWQRNPVAAAAATTCIVATMFVLTINQAALYGHPVRLYLHAIQRNPDSYTLHDNLAELFRKQGRMQEAANHLRKAIELEPRNAKALNDYANILVLDGLLDDAISHYAKSLQHEPNSIEANFNLAMALMDKNRLQEAAAHLEKALSSARATGDLTRAGTIAEQLTKCRNRINERHLP